MEYFEKMYEGVKFLIVLYVYMYIEDKFVLILDIVIICYVDFNLLKLKFLDLMEGCEGC